MPRAAYDLPPAQGDPQAWRGPPRATILVCAEQRTGSTLLGEALYFAGGLGRPLEYFHAGFRPYFARLWDAPDLARYVTALHHHRTDPSGVLSVKLFWSDVEDLVEDIAPGMLAGVPMHDARRVTDATYRTICATVAPILPAPTHIALTRDDTIAQAVSTAVAAQTQHWRKLDARAGTDDAALTFDFHRVVQTLGRIQNANRHWQRYFAANAITPCPVTYEALAGHYTPTLTALLARLGRDGAPIPPPRLHKQADARSEELRARFLAEFRARVGAPPACASAAPDPHQGG